MFSGYGNNGNNFSSDSFGSNYGGNNSNFGAMKSSGGGGGGNYGGGNRAQGPYQCKSFHLHLFPFFLNLRDPGIEV